VQIFVQIFLGILTLGTKTNKFCIFGDLFATKKIEGLKPKIPKHTKTKRSFNKKKKKKKYKMLITF
jgi:hypothetical protein